jgi:NAD(P)-dependent dehydrogenase (short-subunit alcohol dehydrogenase family)
VSTPACPGRRFTGKTAIVTGAAGGIGRSVAIRLAAEGATVALVDRLDEGLDQTYRDVTSQGAQALSHLADVSVADQVRSAVGAAASQFGPVHVLVNCAGVSLRVPFPELTEQQWDYVVDINLKGTYLMCQAAAAAMTDGGGAIVNISSVAAEVASGESVHYAASKGGVRQLTKGLAVSLAAQNIRVNAVGPGPIETAMARERQRLDGGYELLLSRVLRGRLGRPEEVAAAVAFLASDEADFITGTTLYVDGGVLAAR